MRWGTYQTLPALSTPSDNWAGSWFYSATYDATSLVKGWITAGQVTTNGVASYTLGQVLGANTEDPNYSRNVYSSTGTLLRYHRLSAGQPGYR